MPPCAHTDGVKRAARKTPIKKSEPTMMTPYPTPSLGEGLRFFKLRDERTSTNGDDPAAPLRIKEHEQSGKAVLWIVYHGHPLGFPYRIGRGHPNGFAFPGIDGTLRLYSQRRTVKLPHHPVLGLAGL